jgi:hypothetical protein
MGYLINSLILKLKRRLIILSKNKIASKNYELILS